MKAHSSQRVRPSKQPNRLLTAQFIAPSNLALEFADARSFSMSVKRLEMPVDEIDWTTATVSSDGKMMIVLDLRGAEIPIDSSALRCLVDETYDAQVKAKVDELQLTRDELRALAEISEPPQGWDA